MTLYQVIVKQTGQTFPLQSCAASRVPKPGAQADTIRVIVQDEQGTVADSPVELAVYHGPTKLGTVPEKKRTAAMPAVDGVTLAGEALTITRAKDNAAVCALSLPRAADPPTPSAPSASSMASQSHFDEVDIAALTQLSESVKSGYRWHRRAGARVYDLYVLPSGRLASSAPPERISEQDRINIHVLRQSGTAPAFALRYCGGTTPDRTLSRPVALNAGQVFAERDQTKGQDGRTPASESPAAPVFLVESHTGLQCADSLSFVAGSWLPGATSKDTTVADTTRSSIRIDRVYRFVWGVAGAYDFGRPERWLLADRPDSTGKATEKFVSVSNANATPRLFLTLGVHWCGTNPAESRPFNERVKCDLWSPTLGFDVGNPLKRFALALSPVSAYGVNLLVGATVAPSDRLRPGVNVGKPADQQVRAGATWKAPGGLPTEAVYDKKSFGFFIGMSTTAETVASWHLP